MDFHAFAIVLLVIAAYNRYQMNPWTLLRQLGETSRLYIWIIVPIFALWIRIPDSEYRFPFNLL